MVEHDGGDGERADPVERRNVRHAPGTGFGPGGCFRAVTGGVMNRPGVVRGGVAGLLCALVRGCLEGMGVFG
ncbi:Uncharacterised protein [Collinsella intestinalis]|nr:Uncharacterised protein [Collinsella intestinalis]